MPTGFERTLRNFEMVPVGGLGEDQEQTLLHPSEVELGETVRDIMAKVDETKPARVVIDSCRNCACWPRRPSGTAGKSWR